MKHAVQNIHLGRALIPLDGCTTEQKGHSISLLSLCPHCTHLFMPRASSSSLLSILYYGEKGTFSKVLRQGTELWKPYGIGVSLLQRIIQ